MIISIDGPAASGKSITAKLLSKKMGYIHLNSGLIYRAFTYVFLKNNFNSKDNKKYEEFFKNVNITLSGNALNVVLYNKENINKHVYKKNITENIHNICNNIVIRKVITNIQRMVAKNKNIVCEGRDIGTVVFPNANYKFFLTSDIKVRVERRYNQYLENKIKIKKNIIKDMIIKRDINDINRKYSPLKKSKNAIVLDTTKMNIEEQVESIHKMIKGK